VNVFLVKPLHSELLLEDFSEGADALDEAWKQPCSLVLLQATFIYISVVEVIEGLDYL